MYFFYLDLQQRCDNVCCNLLAYLHCYNTLKQQQYNKVQ